MVSAMGLTVVLVLLSVLVHYEALRLTPNLLPKLTIGLRSRTLIVMAGVFIAQTVDIWLYAVALYVSAGHLGMGELRREVDEVFGEYLYFTAVSYTSLGLGDVYPAGSSQR